MEPSPGASIVFNQPCSNWTRNVIRDPILGLWGVKIGLKLIKSTFFSFTRKHLPLIYGLKFDFELIDIKCQGVPIIHQHGKLPFFEGVIIFQLINLGTMGQGGGSFILFHSIQITTQQSRIKGVMISFLDWAQESRFIVSSFNKMVNQVNRYPHMK